MRFIPFQKRVRLESYPPRTHYFCIKDKYVKINIIKKEEEGKLHSDSRDRGKKGDLTKIWQIKIRREIGKFNIILKTCT